VDTQEHFACLWLWTLYPFELELFWSTIARDANRPHGWCSQHHCLLFSAFVLRDELLRETPKPMQVERIGESEHQLLHTSFF